MGLVSEAAAVELGIQTQEDGEARVGIMKNMTMMGMGVKKGTGTTDAFRFDNHLRLCWLPGQERQPMDSFNTSPPGDIGNCHADCDADSDGDDDSDGDFI